MKNWQDYLLPEVIMKNWKISRKTYQCCYTDWRSRISSNFRSSQFAPPNGWFSSHVCNLLLWMAALVHTMADYHDNLTNSIDGWCSPEKSTINYYTFSCSSSIVAYALPAHCDTQIFWADILSSVAILATIIIVHVPHTTWVSWRTLELAEPRLREYRDIHIS